MKLTPLLIPLILGLLFGFTLIYLMNRKIDSDIERIDLGTIYLDNIDSISIETKKLNRKVAIAMFEIGYDKGIEYSELKKKRQHKGVWLKDSLEIDKSIKEMYPIK